MQHVATWRTFAFALKHNKVRHELAEKAIVGIVGISMENQQLPIHNMEVAWASCFKNMVKTIRISKEV